MRSDPRAHLVAAAGATSAAVLGSLGTRVRTRWYRDLDKPRWQPPGWLFGPAWTTLYALGAVSAGRALARSSGSERHQLNRCWAINLALNTGWSWLFFTAQRPAAALVDTALLEVSTLDLVRRTRRVDEPAALMLLPYAGWVAFATALNLEIVRRNRDRSTGRSGRMRRRLLRCRPRRRRPRRGRGTGLGLPRRCGP